MKRLTPALLSPLALGLLLSGAACAAELTLVNFGGANGNAQKVAYVEPFQKSTGTKVVTAEFNGELAKVKAMVEAKKVSWDVVEIDGGDLARACDEGLIEKLDLAKTIKKDDYIPEATVSECGMGAFVWSTVLAYNADKLKTAPTGWADFWDTKKYPGKRGMKKSAVQPGVRPDGRRRADQGRLQGAGHQGRRGARLQEAGPVETQHPVVGCGRPAGAVPGLG
jgi:putative spermidine/putrescine transport system substrate-binding protein